MFTFKNACIIQIANSKSTIRQNHSINMGLFNSLVYCIDDTSPRTGRITSFGQDPSKLSISFDCKTPQEVPCSQTASQATRRVPGKLSGVLVVVVIKNHQETKE